MNLVQHKVLPARVQLGQHIVQQQHGDFPGLAGHKLPLGQLQADGSGTGLALGTVGFQGHTGKGYIKIILVRACQALTALQLCPVVALQVLPELLLQYLHRCKGVGNGGNGVVGKDKVLLAPGKFPVEHRRFPAQAFIKSCPVGDDQGPHLAKSCIVLRQNLQKGGIFLPVFENPVFLLQNLAVLGQGRLIVGPQLAKGVVPQPAAAGGAAFEHHQILRAEQHRLKHPRNLGEGFLFDAVVVQLPGSAGKQHPSEGLLPLLGEKGAGNFRKIRVEAHQFLIFGGAEALSRAQVADGLQKVGFSLGIVPHNQVHPRIEGEAAVPVVAVVMKG